MRDKPLFSGFFYFLKKFFIQNINNSIKFSLNMLKLSCVVTSLGFNNKFKYYKKFGGV